jgi:hypothetical protein
MKTTPGGEASKVDDKAIGLLAYQLWEKAGRPSGSDQHFWFEAEKQLRAKAAQPAPTVSVQIPSAARPKAPEPVRAEPAPPVSTPSVKLSPPRSKPVETRAVEAPKRSNLNRFPTSKSGKN